MTTKKQEYNKNHKLVCWGDYAIPVPIIYNWMSCDESGDIWVYEKKPYIKERWNFHHTIHGQGISLVLRGTNLPTPKPGPWKTQLYWIG